MRALSLFLLTLVSALALRAQTAETALDRYIEDSLARRRSNGASAGSLYDENSLLADLGRDPRAARVGDLITVNVGERASALSSGATTQTRNGETSSGVSRLLGQMGAGRPLPNLFGGKTDDSLKGEASTSRETRVTARITAHVTHVMPNGNLVIEGAKEVAVNDERQLVWIRGVVRQADLAQDNSIDSERIALLDLRVNGKGVVNAAVKRRNPLYRVLHALLPF